MLTYREREKMKTNERKFRMRKCSKNEIEENEI